jgi:ankyrin repeat protein
MWSAKNGHTKCVKILILKEAQCDLRDAEQCTAAELAKKSGHDKLSNAIEIFQ